MSKYVVQVGLAPKGGIIPTREFAMEIDEAPSASTAIVPHTAGKRPAATAPSSAATDISRKSKSRKTEESVKSPTRPIDHVKPVYRALEEEGNPDHRLALKLAGNLGFRIDMSQRYRHATYVDLRPDNIRAAVQDLLENELEYRLMKKRTMSLTDLRTFILYAVPLLVSAFMKALYAKLRTIHFTLQDRKARYTDRPSFPSDAELPAPLASLIQGFGQVRISDFYEDLLIVPTYPENTVNEGAAPGNWSYASYMSILDEIKAVGIPCRSIVMKEMKGGTWWLYQDRVNEARHELVLPFPVTNFSEHGAIQRGLLLNNAIRVNEIQIVNLNTFTDNYGTMLRETGVGDNLLFFRALCHEAQSEWRPPNE
uniref:Coat protein n=1 Tax=Interrupted club-moss deltapartitivirus TaxID=2933089 RepID=A0A9C7LLL5_9VIRU|nr:putative coat protein [Interrupted club-moss deltapartitivirus]CAI5383852.1 putative coat protein [Interrupted club-moss deltapartitivirus]